MAVAGGTLRVKGPEGYCVDADASRTGAEGGFVLLGGSCRAISHHPRDPHPDRPMVLTVAVSAKNSDAPPSDLAALEAHLRSDAGRRALSRSGKAATVAITRSELGDGVLYMRITDDSPNPMGGAVARAYWRAFLDLRGGAMVSVTVTALASQPVEEATALARAKSAVAALQDANPGGPASAAGISLAGLQIVSAVATIQGRLILPRHRALPVPTPPQLIDFQRRFLTRLGEFLIQSQDKTH